MQALAFVTDFEGDHDDEARPDDGHLWRIIQRFLDEEDRTEAWLSRRIGAAPQTLSSWKLRGIRQLPSRKLLRNLAREMGVPYLQVVTAALLDIGVVDEEEADRMTRAERWGRD